MWALMQLIRQGLFLAITIRVKVIWQDSVLNQKGQRILSGSRRRCPDTQTTLPINAAFQIDNLDDFDSDYDEAPSARAVLMA
ncbi:hypothetical protein Tco_0444234, partial [Tanacetum coccineum]